MILCPLVEQVLVVFIIKVLVVVVEIIFFQFGQKGTHVRITVTEDEKTANLSVKLLSDSE